MSMLAWSATPPRVGEGKSPAGALMDTVTAGGRGRKHEVLLSTSISLQSSIQTCNRSRTPSHSCDRAMAVRCADVSREGGRENRDTADLCRVLSSVTIVSHSSLGAELLLAFALDPMTGEDIMYY